MIAYCNARNVSLHHYYYTCASWRNVGWLGPLGLPLYRNCTSSILLTVLDVIGANRRLTMPETMAVSISLGDGVADIHRQLGITPSGESSGVPPTVLGNSTPYPSWVLVFVFGRAESKFAGGYGNAGQRLLFSFAGELGEGEAVKRKLLQPAT